MWFKLEATSSYVKKPTYETYRNELSSFNIRMLHEPYYVKYDDQLYVFQRVFIEINTIEELIRLRDVINNELILCNDRNEIEIYDGYRE